MDIEELKDIILNAKNKKCFELGELNFDFKTINIVKNFSDFTSTYLFLQNQIEGWNKIDVIPSELNASKEYFNKLAQHFDHLAYNCNRLDPGSINQQINAIKSLASPAKTQEIFTYECPETLFVLDVHNKDTSLVPHVFRYLTVIHSNQSINPNTPKSFTAYTMAYEFINRGKTDLISRKEAEEKSLAELKNQFLKYVDKSEKQLNSFLYSAKEKSEKYATQIDETKNNKETAFDTWYNEVKQKHEEFVADTGNHRNDLEKTYRELLRLKGPADYWNIRASKLLRQGRVYMMVLIALVVFSAGLLFFLLHTIPNGVFDKIFDETGKAIKWTIVLIAFLSFTAYGVRLLAKSSFSALHLARDAEEREHLTYLYLALRKNGDVSDEDRQTVLQSLFSRADTGLLKEDSSPSMPGTASGMIDKLILKNLK